MSKVLPATCVGQVVTAAGVPVLTALVQSQGVGPSTGFLILDGPLAYYVAKTAPDLDTTLGKLIDVLTQVKAGLDKAASALTSLDTRGFLVAADAGVPGPPASAADITAIGTATAQIDVLKAELTTLKGALK